MYVRTRMYQCVQNCENSVPCLKDHLSIVAAVGYSMGHLSDTTVPLYKDPLSTETTVGCSMGHLSDTTVPLYKDPLSTKTTITWCPEWSLLTSLLYTVILYNPT